MHIDPIIMTKFKWHGVGGGGDVKNYLHVTHCLVLSPWHVSFTKSGTDDVTHSNVLGLKAVLSLLTY